jgi:hypothetical protein
MIIVLHIYIALRVYYVIIIIMEVLNMAKVRTTVTIDEELLKEVTELSEEEERSISQQIVYLIKLGMRRKEFLSQNREE